MRGEGGGRTELQWQAGMSSLWRQLRNNAPRSQVLKHVRLGNDRQLRGIWESCLPLTRSITGVCRPPWHANAAITSFYLSTCTRARTPTGTAPHCTARPQIYYCVRLHPDGDKQDVLLAGCADKKVYQWDIRSGDLMQEYDYHLAAVCTHHVIRRLL